MNLLWLYRVFSVLFGWLVTSYYCSLSKNRGTANLRHGIFSYEIQEKFNSWQIKRIQGDLDTVVVWFHAVSVGEVNAARPVIEKWREVFPDHKIIVSTITTTGQAHALRVLNELVDIITYAPFDIPYIVERFLNKIDPDYYFSFESDSWPNLLSALNHRQVSTGLLNARLSLHNLRGITKSFRYSLFKMYDLIVCQNSSQEQNFRFLLGDKKPPLIVTSGNTKFDLKTTITPVEELNKFKNLLGWIDAYIVVAGSTHPLKDNPDYCSEEEIVIHAFSQWQVNNSDKKLKLIIAPRHPERCEDVVQMLINFQSRHSLSYKISTLSEIEKNPGSDAEKQLDVLIIDRLGILMELFQLADLVIMGGTFSKTVGGHNILEPAAYKTPIIIGPYHYTIQQTVADMETNQGIMIVNDPDMLIKSGHELISNTGAAIVLAERSYEIYLKGKGSAVKTIELILDSFNLFPLLFEAEGVHNDTIDELIEMHDQDMGVNEVINSIDPQELNSKEDPSDAIL